MYQEEEEEEEEDSVVMSLSKLSQRVHLPLADAFNLWP